MLYGSPEGVRRDRIVIPALPVRSHIGVSAEERAEEQELRVSLELLLDLSPAGKLDDLNHSVDYVAVVEAVRQAAASRPRRLLETLAEDLARTILSRFGAEGVRVRIEKPSALESYGVGYAAVEIER